MIIMDEARYSLAVAAKVWGLPTPTARLYMNEYLSLGPHDRKAAGQGATALLTARRVLQGAIGAELAPSFRTAALACKAVWTPKVGTRGRLRKSMHIESIMP